MLNLLLNKTMNQVTLKSKGNLSSQRKMAEENESYHLLS